MQETVNLELTKAEALVFFEWLGRFNKEDSAVKDQAEQRVLWNIESVLESVLAEPFRPDYDKILEEAYQSLRDDSFSH